jgi:hypothetical protein
MLEFVLFLREPYSLREAFFTDRPLLLHSCPGGVASVQVFAQAPMRDKRGSGEMNLCSDSAGIDPAQAAALHKVCARHSTQQLGSNTPAGKSLVPTDEAPVLLRSCRPPPFARPHPTLTPCRPFSRPETAPAATRPQLSAPRMCVAGLPCYFFQRFEPAATRVRSPLRLRST